MRYSDQCKMVKIKIEDILFWISIAAIIAISLWLLSGSPPEINALISIALFVAVSEILLWKALFNIDKRTAVGFSKIKSDINNFRTNIINQLNEISNKLKNIEKLVKIK